MTQARHFYQEEIVITGVYEKPELVRLENIIRLSCDSAGSGCDPGDPGDDNRGGSDKG